MVGDSAFSHKIDYVTIFKETLNLKGHPNCIRGSKFTSIFLNGWILPIGGASAVKALRLQLAQQACLNRPGLAEAVMICENIFIKPSFPNLKS